MSDFLDKYAVIYIGTCYFMASIEVFDTLEEAKESASKEKLSTTLVVKIKEVKQRSYRFL